MRLFPTPSPFTLLIPQWHPSAPRLASTTNQGTILIWHSPSPERWGAFAGGFEEADENVWYEEGESEFDLASLPEFLVNRHSILPSRTGRRNSNCAPEKTPRRRRRRYFRRDRGR